MKRVLAFSLAVLFLSLAARIWKEPLAAQARGSGGGEARKNGDVNGDGALSLADITYLVDHLFQGGPEPVAFAQTLPPEPARWPPRPEAIVNLSVEQQVHLDPRQPGDTLVPIFPVPPGKWLIVTDFSYRSSNDEEEEGGELVEVVADAVTVKRGRQFTGSYNWYGGYEIRCVNRFDGCGGPLYFNTTPGFGRTAGPYSSPVGLAFRPGSTAALRITRDHTASEVSYTLTGYLADA